MQHNTTRSCLSLTPVALLFVMAASPLGAAEPGALKPVEPSSRLIVQTWKDGPAARLAHDHAIAATVYTGSVRYDQGAADPLAVQVTVDARRLVVDDDDVRKLVGLEPGVPADDKAEVYKSMTSDAQLDVARFPTISFESRSSVRQADGSILLKGTLTLHGVRREVSLPVQIVETTAGLRGRGTLALRTSDYGIQPYSAFFGAVKVKDGVLLHLDLRVAR